MRIPAAELGMMVVVVRAYMSVKVCGVVIILLFLLECRVDRMNLMRAHIPPCSPMRKAPFSPANTRHGTNALYVHIYV